MNSTSHRNRHPSRPVRLAVAALAAAGVATTAVVMAAPGYAAPSPEASYASGKVKLSRGLLSIKGTRASDEIVLRLRDGSPEILEVDFGDDGYANYSFERADVARITVAAGAGDDLVRIDEENGVFTDSISTTLRGGGGDDSLVGGSGAEVFVGGDGNDSIDGNRGNDAAFMGADDDLFVWDPGDGSDAIEGQRGRDRMLFNGANADEPVDLSANGTRLRFFREPGAITMDTAGVEQVDFVALGGADVVTINDLSQTDVDEVNVDLAGTPGSTAGDGQADRVVVNGTNANDAITVRGDAGAVQVTGLAATIAILHPEAANDQLEIKTLEGTDNVGSGGLAPGTIPLLVDGVLVP
jgi:RTX calcium-binding nonapeptide repeat (4 copies)